MFHCNVDLSRFREAVGRTLDGLQHGIDSSVRSAAYAGEREAKAGHFKDQTGELRRKIQARQLRGGHLTATWTIVAGTGYAKFVDEGTRPHEIVARRAGMLRWEDEGGVHFARKVQHPGTKATAFFGKAYLKAEAVLFRDLGLMVSDLVRLWS